MSTEKKPLIVVVDDEVELAKVIAENLEQSDLQTATFHNSTQTLKFLQNNFANLLLLDLNLPDQDGFTLLEQMKKEGIQIPTIFVTGNHATSNVVRGLEMGGDDYVKKPFHFPELIARINAVLRRTETMHDQKVTTNVSLTQEPFDFCGATIIPNRLEIKFPNGKIEILGKKELGIMQYMFAHKGEVVTRRNLIHGIWGVHADVRSRSLDQYLVKIRDRLTENGCDLAAMRTVHGVGYLYDPEPQQSKN
ncbi:MAG: response regulator transcription factor [Opitutales bacterium]|nr:response regulator transcription factor [Opitutales bacterium]